MTFTPEQAQWFTDWRRKQDEALKLHNEAMIALLRNGESRAAHRTLKIAGSFAAGAAIGFIAACLLSTERAA